MISLLFTNDQQKAAIVLKHYLNDIEINYICCLLFIDTVAKTELLVIVDFGNINLEQEN